MELDEAGPVEGVVCGDQFDGVGRVEVGAVAAVVAALLDMLPCFVEIGFDLFGFADGFRRRLPILSDVALRVYALVIASMGELCYAGEDGDAATSEAHEAVDLVALRVVLGIALEVVAVEEREVPATAQASQYVQIGKPAGQEMIDFSVARA